MGKRFKTVGMISLIVFLLCALPVYAAVIVSENFNLLTAGTNITTSNTNFDYVRIGSGGGTITAEQAASGEIHMRLGGSSSTSLNGVGIQSGLGNATITTVNFRIKLEDVNGNVCIGMGSGSTFTGNSVFSAADLMWAIQSDNGTLKYRTTDWYSAGQVLSANTNYEFHVVANRSGAMINYGSEDLPDATMDVYINGALIGDDLPIANNQNGDSFRIYQISGSSYARIDSITVDNSAVAPFAPTAITLRGLSARSAGTGLPMAGLLLVGVLLTGAAVGRFPFRRA